MLDGPRIERIMARKREARIEAIEALRKGARTRGESDDPGFWALVHDLERANPTTNLAQLAEIGVPVPNENVLDDQEVAASLGTIIEALAFLDVFLRHTDHLDDRSLHRELRARILRETVMDLPSGIGSREWIDLAGGVDRSAYLAVHACREVREVAAAAGEWLPRRLRRLAERDRHLPRPASPS